MLYFDVVWRGFIQKQKDRLFWTKKYAVLKMHFMAKNK
jgi:hypothetical protein